MTAIRHALKLRGHDLYQTPPEAVLALMRAERLPRTIWEPACGPGSIVRTLRAEGHSVLASDLVDYETPDQDWCRRDFLLETALPEGVEAIVTNPPYKLASEFAFHALSLCPRVYMLLKLSFLEGWNANTLAARAREAALDDGWLRRVLVFRERLPMMHRDGWDGPKATSTIAFAWFCWDQRGESGLARVERISWKDGPEAA